MRDLSNSTSFHSKQMRINITIELKIYNLYSLPENQYILTNLLEQNF